MSFNLRKGALTGLAILAFSGCNALKQDKTPQENFYPQNLVYNTVPYDVSSGAEDHLRKVEDLYLREHPSFKGMARLPDRMRVSIRAEADKLGVRNRKITEAEAKAFHELVVRRYEANLRLPEFEPMYFDEQ